LSSRDDSSPENLTILIHTTMKSIFALILALFTAASIAKADPVNKDCPVSGKAADKSKTSEYAKTVAFCCEKCKAKFDADPKSFVAKVASYDAKDAKCPVSGKKVDEKVTSEYKATVGFCCAKCKGKFDAAPDKFIEKAVK
jgi:YHS domain-containing protein